MDNSKTPVKVTYSKRSQRGTRRAGNVEQNDESDSDTNASEMNTARTPSMKPLSRPNSAKRTPKTESSASLKSAVSASSTKLPRRIDPRDVPAPTPKRGRSRRNSIAREDSEENAMASTSRTGTPATRHTRSRSTASVKSPLVKPEEDDAPRTRARSRSRARSVSRADEASVISAKMRSKAGTSAWDEEDGSIADSIADSSVGASGGRVSRTASDRQEYFKNQSDCHAFGPHRALCSRCKQFVNLTRKQTYAVGPWERHRAKCDQELASDLPLPADAQKLVNATVEEIFDGQPVRRKAADRHSYLMADELAASVEEERVECAKCKKWVAGRKGHPYDLTKWKQHRDRCAVDTPPNDAASMERKAKLAIVNDPQVKTFDGATIECARCDAKIAGSVGQDYDLAAWEQHKAQCGIISEKNTDQASEGVSSVPFPTTSAAKPSSESTTEDTLVAPGSATQTAPSTKRSRDDEEEDERPINRQRMEKSDEPADQEESRTLVGWFMLPFHSFARGFRESLRNGSAPS